MQEQEVQQRAAQPVDARDQDQVDLAALHQPHEAAQGWPLHVLAGCPLLAKHGHNLVRAVALFADLHFALQASDLGVEAALFGAGLEIGGDAGVEGDAGGMGAGVVCLMAHGGAIIQHFNVGSGIIWQVKRSLKSVAVKCGETWTYGGSIWP